MPGIVMRSVFAAALCLLVAGCGWLSIEGPYEVVTEAPGDNLDAGAGGGGPGAGGPVAPGGDGNGGIQPPVSGSALYAVPEKTSATVGEQVLITVSMGQMSTPFQFCTGVGLVTGTSATYVANSFNVGSPGGAKGDSDGIWASMDHDGFLLPPDNLMFGQETDLGNGTHRLDFNVTPLFGEELVNIGGDLFNFRLEFSEPGTYVLGFEQFNGVERTYFSDGEGAVLFWDDLSNDHQGFANTVIVTN